MTSVALIGFGALVAAAVGNGHRIEAEGAFGTFEFAAAGRALPDDPKTSMLAPCSLARSILNLRASIALA